jgi:hypothetical protein
MLLFNKDLRIWQRDLKAELALISETNTLSETVPLAMERAFRE